MNKHYKEGLKHREVYELEDILEGLIDQHSLETVLGMIENICERKADHMIHVWGDRAEARWWGLKAGMLGKM